MGILLSVIECTDQQPGELARRIPRDGSAETKFGSQLVVRDYQAAIFRKDGKGLDVFGPGRHTLTTKNIPILTKVLSLPFGFTSPFRCEVIFISLRTIPDLKWGTREPVPFRDSELGLVRLRAFGTYGLRVADPLVFTNSLVGADGLYTTGALEEYLRSTIVQRLNDWMGENAKSVFDLASEYDEASNAMLAKLSGDRSVETVALKEVQPLTGYIRGGVTVLGAKKDFPVFADASLVTHESVAVSAGVRGTQLVLDPKDYARAVKAKLGPIARAKTPAE